MSGHRYWGISTTAASVSPVAFGAAAFRLTGGGPSQTAGPVCNAQLYGAEFGIGTGGSAYEAFTGSGYWFSGTSGYGWIGWYFGILGAQTIFEFAVTSVNNSSYNLYGPENFDLDYSDDGVSWATAASFTGVTWTPNQTQTFATGVATPHLWWRLNTTLTGTAGRVLFSTLALHATSGGPQLCVLSASATSINSGEGGQYAPANATSNIIPASGGGVYGAATGIVAAIWSYDFGAANTPAFQQLALTGPGGPTAADTQGPTAFSIVFSDDGITWTAAATFTGVSWTSAYEVQLFTIPQPPAVPTGLTVGDATTTSLTASWTGSGAVSADTLNPADLTHLTLSGGNLTATHDGTGSGGGVRSIHSQTTGKYYFEWQLDSLSIGSGGSDTGCGIALASYTLGTNPPGGATGLAAAFPANPFLGSGHWHISLWVNTSNVVSDVAGFDTTVQPFGVAVDLTAKLYWAFCPSNGTWNGSGTANPATGIGGIDISAIVTGPLFAMVVLNGATSDAITVNFGATSFSNAVPSGFFAGWPGGAPPAVTYTLQYRLTGTTTWTQVAGITGTSLTVTGLTPGTEYDFQVEAVSADGPSGFTPTVQAFTLGLAGTVVFTPAQLPGWRAQCGINWNGMALVGDAFAGVVGLSDFAAFTEYGNPMIMQITSPPIQDSKMRVFIRLFEVYMQALGQTANANPPVDDPKLWLDYSRDGGASFGAALLPRSIGRTGVNTARLRWQQLGAAREWVLRLTCSDPVRRAIIGTYIRLKLGQS